ncbi:hypothetical protein SGPA1_40418 [Streptomyces misionensis JCM 4497]
MEQHPHRRGGDRLGREPRAGGQGRLLRPGGGPEGHGAEPSAPGTLPGRHGAAGHARRAGSAGPQGGRAAFGAAADRVRRGAPHPPRPLHGGADRRPRGALVHGRGGCGPGARHRDVRRGGAGAGQLALGGHDIPAAQRQGTARRPQGGGGAVPAGAPSAVRAQRGGGPQCAALRSGAGGPDAGSDGHGFPGRSPDRAGTVRATGAGRTARVRAAVAGRPAGRSGVVHPRRRGGGGVAGADAGPLGLGAGARSAGGVSGGLGRAGVPARLRSRAGDQGRPAARGDGAAHVGRSRRQAVSGGRRDAS